MPERKEHIFLTGMMGSGKSSCGHELARRFNYVFIDLDKEIEKERKKSIPDIFREEGESAFRDYESECAKQLRLSDPAVIATGGGFPLRESNRIWMREKGITIWLKADVQTLTQRVKGTSRPLLPYPEDSRTIAAILEKRIPFYRKADIHIDTTNKNFTEVCNEIIGKIS